jgi:hypothetical protein
MNIKHGLLIAIITAPLSLLIADDAYVSPEASFVQANQLVEKGDYVKSLEIYDSLLAQGFEGPSLYYNLGNVHFRRGERGKAVLWYERAARLSPRDSDIRFNLSIARSHIRDEEKNWAQQIVLHFTNNELSWIVLVLSWVFFVVLGGVALGRIRNETWTQVYLWLSGSAMVFFLIWLGLNSKWSNDPVAIVVSPPGEVRNGPGNEYAVGFTIPEGSTVLIMNKRPDWVQVGVPQQGLKGGSEDYEG